MAQAREKEGEKRKETHAWSNSQNMCLHESDCWSGSEGVKCKEILVEMPLLWVDEFGDWVVVCGCGE